MARSVSGSGDREFERFPPRPAQVLHLGSVRLTYCAQCQWQHRSPTGRLQEGDYFRFSVRLFTCSGLQSLSPCHPLRRTRYPNVIILYETFYVTLSENRLFALLLALLNGRFQMVLEYQGQEEEILIGHSFNRDLLHRVHLYINPELGFLNIRVNASESTKYYKSLYFNSTFLPNDQALTTYKLSLGGIPFLNQTAYYQLNGYRNLVGCIGNLNIISRSNESNFGTLSLSHLSMHNVLDGCIDRCDQLNLCSRRARCVNYYDSKECDCFGSELEDWHCRSFNYTVLTLRGYSTISYHIYPFLSRTYSSEHLISLHIKTQQDGILFAALSETFQSYLILNIKNGFLNVFFNLGSNPKNYIYNDFQLSDDLWHNVTLVQHHSKIFVYLDTDTRHVITLDETDPYFFFDPGNRSSHNESLSLMLICSCRNLCRWLSFQSEHF